MEKEILHNLTTVRKKIVIAAQNAQRNPLNIKLIAVTKKKDPSYILDSLKWGQTHFGENYVQEFIHKYNDIPVKHIKWHFLGPLQRNKVKDIVGRVFLIQTLDRIELAQSIEKYCLEKGIVQNCLIQVKLSNEQTKHGCHTDDINNLLNKLNALKHIRIKGLMMIGTLTDDMNLTQQEFKMLREIRDEINKKNYYKYPLTELSMGMSHDFEVAIEEGATMVRIGTALFGERQ